MDNPWSDPVEVKLSFTLPAPRSARAKSNSAASKPHCDIDKLARSCLDALQGVVYRDDVQVTRLEARKMVSREYESGVWIEVKPA